MSVQRTNQGCWKNLSKCQFSVMGSILAGYWALISFHLLKNHKHDLLAKKVSLAGDKLRIFLISDLHSKIILRDLGASSEELYYSTKIVQPFLNALQYLYQTLHWLGYLRSGQVGICLFKKKILRTSIIQNFTLSITHMLSLHHFQAINFPMGFLTCSLVQIELIIYLVQVCLKRILQLSPHRRLKK